MAGGWFFLLHFHPKLDAFSQATSELQINATLPFDIPNAPESLDVGTSTHADDTIREIPGISAENVITGINRSNNALDTALAPDHVQNSGKQEILPHFRSRVTRRVSNHFLVIFTIWRVVFTAVFDTWDHTLLLTDVCGAETSRRVQAARNTFSLFKRFFAKTASLRWRRGCFSCNGGWCGSLWLGCSCLVIGLKRSLELARKCSCWRGHVYRRTHAHKLVQMDMETAHVGPNRCGSGSAAIAVGNNKLLVNPRPRGHFCSALFGCIPGTPYVVDNGGAATLFAHSWLRLLVSDLQRLNNVLQLDDLDDAVAYPAKLFWSRTRYSTQRSMCWWPSGRLNASRLHMCHVTSKKFPPPVVDADIELPFV